MPTDELTREELEQALEWVVDFLDQIESANSAWLPMGFADVPDRRWLRVFERMLRSALKRRGDGHGSYLAIQD